MAESPRATEISEFAEDLASGADTFARSIGGTSETGRTAGEGATAGMAMLMRIPVTVKVVLGTTTMPVSALGRMGPGTLLPLDRKLTELVDIVVNGQVVARGEVVIADETGSRFAVSVVEVGDG